MVSCRDGWMTSLISMTSTSYLYCKAPYQISRKNNDTLGEPSRWAPLKHHLCKMGSDDSLRCFCNQWHHSPKRVHHNKMPYLCNKVNSDTQLTPFISFDDSYLLTACCFGIWVPLSTRPIRNQQDSAIPEREYALINKEDNTRFLISRCT